MRHFDFRFTRSVIYIPTKNTNITETPTYEIIEPHIFIYRPVTIKLKIRRNTTLRANGVNGKCAFILTSNPKSFYL